jgi:hypothetical protein
MALRAPPGWTPEIVQFVQRVNAAYQAAGTPPLTVTSWFRTHAENNRVGGNAVSQHLTGLAIDVARPSSAAAERFAREAQRAGLVPVYEGDHWHIQFRASRSAVCCGAAIGVQVREPSVVERARRFIARPRFSIFDVLTAPF